MRRELRFFDEDAKESIYESFDYGNCQEHNENEFLFLGTVFVNGHTAYLPMQAFVVLPYKMVGRSKFFVHVYTSCRLNVELRRHRRRSPSAQS